MTPFEAYSRLATSALVAAVWQGAVLAGGVALVLRLLPRASAALRFTVWAAVFGVVTLLPVAHLLRHGAGAGDTFGRGIVVDVRWSFAVAAVWAMLSVVRAVTLVVAAVRIRALWKRATPVQFEGTPGSTARVPHRSRPCERWDVRSPLICTSDEVDRPSVIGFFAPRILIPTWLYGKLTRSDLEQIVLHETGHLRRSDDWMNLLQKIALVVFPLNPALLWVERKLCFERELACDDGVLEATKAPKAYALCLTALAEHRMGRRGLTLSLGALERVSELERRVESILRGGARMSPRRARLAMGAALLALIAGAAELSRSPELVGFSSGAVSATVREQGSNAGFRAQGAGIRLPEGYAMRDVVYRPNTLQRSSLSDRATTLNRPGALDRTPHCHTAQPPTAVILAQPESPACSSNPPTLRRSVLAGAEKGRTVSARRSASGSVDFESQKTGLSVAEWVMVTSWSTTDGSRMVLTQAVVQTGDAPDAPPPTAKPAEFRPYAAVATRDGWLLIQL